MNLKLKKNSRLMEMPHLRKAAQSAASLSCLEKYKKRLDSPTFPQALLIIFDIFKMNPGKTGIDIYTNVLYFNRLHSFYYPQILLGKRFL